MKDAERDAIRGFILGEVSREVRRSVGEIDLETLRGPAGKDGVDGKDGSPGERGVDGKDGAPGADGKDGVGIQGEKGLDGINGKDGAPGLNGKDGDPGTRGEKGLDGKDGRDGREGKDGKDGITIEQLEAATLKALGAALGEIRLDGRNLMLGERLIKTLPIPLYMGVFELGKSYEPGDMITFGGNVWHCDEATSEKPETTRAWKLAVKKGRDGREPARMAEKGIVKR